jgi:hypothetical protein
LCVSWNFEILQLLSETKPDSALRHARPESGSPCCQRLIFLKDGGIASSALEQVSAPEVLARFEL